MARILHLMRSSEYAGTLRTAGYNTCAVGYDFFIGRKASGVNNDAHRRSVYLFLKYFD